MTKKLFSPSLKGYADMRQEVSFGERFYLDGDTLSRYLKIHRDGKIYRVASPEGFVPSEYPIRATGANDFSKFVRQVWDSQTVEKQDFVIPKDKTHQVPTALLKTAREYSLDYGLRFTWEKKYIRFQNSLGTLKSKSETMNLIRIDRTSTQSNSKVHLRKFLYSPTTDDLTQAFSDLKKIEASLKEVRPIESSPSTQVVLDPGAASVWLHEVVGHWAEKVSSIEQIQYLSKNEIAPKFISVYDTPNQNRSVFKFAFDDEGVVSKRVNLIHDGFFQEPYLSIERAFLLGLQHSNGHARAQDFKFLPTPRMMNICLAPGSNSYKQMIENIDDGYLLCGSLGGLRGNTISQVQCQYGYRILQGKLKHPVCGPLMITLNSTALKNVLAVSKEFEFIQDGGCQAEGQFIDQSGRGAPYIWLKNVQIH